MSLDPIERLKEQQRKEFDERQNVAPLNPPFPYRTTPFDPWAFGVEKDPPKKATEQ